MRGASVDVAVRGCKVYNSGRKPFRQNGILVMSGAQGTRLEGNDLLTGAHTTSLSDSGTGTHRYRNRLSHGALSGLATLTGGVSTVVTEEVQAGDVIVLSRVTPGGTLGHLSVGRVTPAVNFVINSSSSSETSSVFWEIAH